MVGSYLVTHGLGVGEGIKPINSSLEAIKIPGGQDPREFIREHNDPVSTKHGILYDYDEKLCVNNLMNENINYVLNPDKEKYIAYDCGSVKLYSTSANFLDLKLASHLATAIEIHLALES